MGMRDFKTNKNKLNEGIWIELPPNKDGTIPRIKARGAGDFNPEYSKLMSQKVKKVVKLLQFEGPAADKARQKILNEMTIEYVFAGWENMQPNDDGVSLDFNHHNVEMLVSDDDWKPLINYVIAEASSHDKYNSEALEAIAGN